MQEIPARAALVPAPDVADGLTTFVSRDEVKSAMQGSSGPLELVLDVTRFEDGDAAETRSVAVAWERKDLEQLLGQTEGEQVLLTFDGKALRDAFESDVEAHGIREKALVLTVAGAAVAGITAGPALGSDDRAVSRATAITQTSLGADDRDVSRADPTSQPSLHADDRAVSRTDPLSQPSIGADDRAVPRAAPEPVTGVPGPSPDDRALPRTDPLSQPSLGPDDRALPRTDPVAQPTPGPDDRALPRTSPVPVSQQPGLSPDDRALPRTDPVSQPSLGPDDRPLPRTDPLAQPQPLTGTSDDGTFIEAPSPGTIAVIGGIALAITGAAFAAAAASRRRVHPA
jgi:hypothetical protein